jgi:hypothetical protein
LHGVQPVLNVGSTENLNVGFAGEDRLVAAMRCIPQHLPSSPIRLPVDSLPQSLHSFPFRQPQSKHWSIRTNHPPPPFSFHFTPAPSTQHCNLRTPSQSQHFAKHCSIFSFNPVTHTVLHPHCIILTCFHFSTSCHFSCLGWLQLFHSQRPISLALPGPTPFISSHFLIIYPF